jgi:hypothetical protein
VELFLYLKQLCFCCCYSAFLLGGAALVVDGLLLLLVGQYLNVPLDMRKILAFLEQLYPLLLEQYL